MGFSNIHSTIRDNYWSLWCQEWSSHQYQSFFWWNEAVEVIEAIEAVEATEVIEAAEVLRPGKSQLRTSESSRHLNSALFLWFEKKFFGVESWNIIFNFSTFSFGGCWGQPMLLFWKLVDETQMPKPQKYTDTFILIKKMVFSWPQRSSKYVKSGRKTL